MQPQGTPPVDKEELAQMVAELVQKSSNKLIEFGVIGAAFFLVLVLCALLVYLVLKAAVREIRDARTETANANARSSQVSDKAVSNVAIMNERQSRVIEMLNDLLTLMHLREGRKDVDPPISSQDGQ